MHDVDRQQRLAAARASRQLNRGTISRRRFLRLCAEAGFAFGGLSGLGLLGGCRERRAAIPSREALRDTPGPLSASVPGTDCQKFLRDVGRPFSGTTLRVVSEDSPSSRATVKILREEFTPVTGIEVLWEQLPLERVLAAISQDTASRAGYYDVFAWDQSWIGRFADDGIDPRELMARADLAYPGYDFDDFLPPLLEHVSSYRGRLAAIPFDIPIWITVYRRDLFEELGLKPPVTMAQYLEAVRAITEAKAPQVYGTTGGWKPGHSSLLQRAAPWLWGHGGSFFHADETPAIDDENAVAGMEYMLKLGKDMPPACTTWDWFGETESFARGQAGIYLGSSELFPYLDDPETSILEGRAEAFPAPRPLALRASSECAFGEKPGVSHHSGSSLAISRYGRHVEASWVLLQWATSADVLTRASLLGSGASATRRSVYADPRVRERARVGAGTTRHFDIARDAILHQLGNEPHLEAWPRLSLDLAIELGRMTTGQQDVRKTLSAMAQTVAGALAAQGRA
ncbi:MAG TPA: extracellular solute-binding protein [Thermoanaerobaculia bacterium]|nr:extracellular solute-binding protein [Thermoanaerobaculia bacterium]